MSFTIYSSILLYALARATFLCWFVIILFSFRLARTYIGPFVLKLARCILDKGFAHMAEENSDDKFLFAETGADYVSFLITVFPCSSISVTSGWRGHGQTLFRALVADSRSVSITGGRYLLGKQNVSHLVHLTQKKYTKLLKRSFLTFSFMK